MYFWLRLIHQLVQPATPGHRTTTPLVTPFPLFCNSVSAESVTLIVGSCTSDPKHTQPLTGFGTEPVYCFYYTPWIVSDARLRPAVRCSSYLLGIAFSGNWKPMERDFIKKRRKAKFPLRTTRGCTITSFVMKASTYTSQTAESHTSASGSPSTCVATASVRTKPLVRLQFLILMGNMGDVKSLPGRMRTNGFLRDLSRCSWDECLSCKYFQGQGLLLGVRKM